MNIIERAEKAALLKKNGQCNCTQAVLNVFTDVLPENISDLMILTQGFAAGMGCMESTCGALIGAVMIAGVLSDGQGTARLAKSMVEEFKQKSGATICRELKGIDTGKILCPCPDCVKNAVLTLNQIIEE